MAKLFASEWPWRSRERGPRPRWLRYSTEFDVEALLPGRPADDRRRGHQRDPAERDCGAAGQARRPGLEQAQPAERPTSHPASAPHAGNLRTYAGVLYRRARYLLSSIRGIDRGRVSQWRQGKMGVRRGAPRSVIKVSGDYGPYERCAQACPCQANGRRRASLALGVTSVLIAVLALITATRGPVGIRSALPGRPRPPHGAGRRDRHHRGERCPTEPDGAGQRGGQQGTLRTSKSPTPRRQVVHR